MTCCIDKPPDARLPCGKHLSELAYQARAGFARLPTYTALACQDEARQQGDEKPLEILHYSRRTSYISEDVISPVGEYEVPKGLQVPSSNHIEPD